MKLQHTPTPWKHDKRGGDIRAENDCPIASGLMFADAAFIVKAVNCHEELLEMVKEMYSAITNGHALEFTHSQYSEAIAKAGGLNND